jgi:AcrR family transcriptional regulator
MKSRRDQNVEATRAAILAVARRHFARDGYSASEIGKIAADARVTTGAVYHHFSNKKALLIAVAESLEREILQAAAGVEHPDPWQRVVLGFEKMIDVCAAPGIQRIIFIEAPQVIGPDEWRKVELQYTYGLLRTVLGALIKAKIIKPYPVDLIARTMLALLHETSAELARSKFDSKVRAQVSELAHGVLSALLLTQT